ncbi:Nuclear pore complex protein Nup155 [Galdieria sulphuraria]|nr:Nuclear pore complex protein Nup155 [Galdieria sulphuraria]
MEEAKKAEYRSLLSLYHLACRISEALSLISILYDNQFHRLVSSLTEPYYASLQRITFGDFCVSEAGRRLASSLITTLFQYNGQEEEGLVESLTELLSSQCPSFFGKEERCLQSGMDLLSRARSQLQISEDTHQVYQLVERAIEEFRKVIPVIENWKEICTKIESIGAISLLFGFLLEAIVTIRFQQQSEKLEECYEILLSLIQRYLLIDASSFYCSKGEIAHEETWKDAIIQRIRQLKDEGFYKRLCSYLLSIDERGTSLLIGLASPFVESYLLEQERYDVLWKYYGHEGRCKEAAAVLVKLSKESPSLSLDERISWLGQALQLANLQLAKSGGSSADERVLVKEIQDCLDVAKIQVRCKEELVRRHPSYSDIEEPMLSYVQSIDKKLMDLSTIYNHIARPMELWETELDILRCAEYEDMGLVQHLWICLVDDCLFPQSSKDTDVYSPNGENWKSLERLCVRLGKDFSSSMNIFPLNFLVQFLEQRHFEWLQLRTAETGHIYFDVHIYRWFVSIGHSRDMILSSYCKCLEEGPSFVVPLRMRGSFCEITSWSHDIAQYHLIQVIKNIIEDKISADVRISSLLSGQSGLREESLQRAVSLCCNRLRVLHVEGREALLNAFSTLKRL